jgi:hypothetical protein
MNLTLEQLNEALAKARLSSMSIPLDARVLADLIGYARERAAREACEALLPDPRCYIWTEGPYDGSTDRRGNKTILGFSAHAFQLTDVSAVRTIAEAQGLTLTEAYLALLAKLEKALRVMPPRTSRGS